MDTPKIRLLVVEDFAAFRRFISSTLNQDPQLQILFESSDGQEAVQKAAELLPDLILLDIGLPRLNGLAAARQILELVPASKIIFVSQESSPDVIKEAFRLGAWGYVLKTRAAKDLREAVHAVIDGQRFVSGGSSGYILSDADPSPDDLSWRSPVERVGESRTGAAPPESRD